MVFIVTETFHYKKNTDFLYCTIMTQYRANVIFLNLVIYKTNSFPFNSDLKGMWSMWYVQYHKGDENTLFSVYRQKRMNTGTILTLIDSKRNHNISKRIIIMKIIPVTIIYFLFFYSMED